MRTMLRSKVTLLFMLLGLLVAIPAVALADTISGDADADALASPHANSVNFNQQPGTTVAYNFDAYIRQQGSATDDVFKNPGDNVKVSIARAGAWTDQTDAGSPANMTFTKYTDPAATSGGANDFTQSGTIRVTVPCDTAAGTQQTMTATLTGVAYDDGPDNVVGTADDVQLPSARQLGGGGDITLSYVITAQGANAASCTPPDTTAPTVTASASPATIGASGSSTITWKANENGSFSVRVGGTSCSTGTQIDSGNYTTQPNNTTSTVNASDLSEGGNTIRVCVTDAANNTGFATTTVTKDTIAPVVTLTQVNGSARTFPYFTNQNVASVGGSCTNGDGNVSVTLDGNATDPATATCSSGSWTLTLTSELSAEGTYVFAASQTDAAGNTGASGNKSVQIDTTAPTVTPSADRLKADSSVDGTYTEGTWTNQSVRVTFACADNDGGSGLTAASGPQTLADFTTDSADADGTIADFSGTCTDKAGNSATSDLHFTLKIDKTDPTLGTIVDNNAATSNVCTASAPPTKPTGFNPSDSLSGLNTSSETWTLDGVPVANAPDPFGTYSYSASATDNATNTDSYSKTYNYSYGIGSGGLAYNGVLQPINTDGSSRFKLGSTVPVKFTVSCGQTPYDGAVAGLFVKKSDSTVVGDVNEAISTSAATTGNLFRYDATAGQYIFNLSTKQGYTDGNNQTQKFSLGTWIITIKFLDGTTKTATFDLK